MSKKSLQQQQQQQQQRYYQWMNQQGGGGGGGGTPMQQHQSLDAVLNESMPWTTASNPMSPGNKKIFVSIYT
jgi:hypothetical protein